MEEEVWTCEEIIEISISESTFAGNEVHRLTATGAEYLRLM